KHRDASGENEAAKQCEAASTETPSPDEEAEDEKKQSSENLRISAKLPTALLLFNHIACACRLCRTHERNRRIVIFVRNLDLHAANRTRQSPIDRYGMLVPNVSSDTASFE